MSDPHSAAPPLSCRSPSYRSSFARYLLALWLLLAAQSLFASCPVVDTVRALPAPAQGELLVASQNLWNLMAPGPQGRNRPTPEGLSARLDALAAYVLDVLSAPHILAVQEVESLALLEALAERISASGGPQYQAWLLSGHDPSGIDVGMLARAPVSGVTVRQVFQGERNLGHWLFHRPPLHVTVEAPFALELLIVHNRSGHGLDDARRSRQVKARRLAQAKALRGWALARISEGVPLMLIGDFNTAPDAGDYGEPFEYLNRPPLHSHWSAVPQPDRFTYIHRCQRQAIDHAFLSPRLQARLQRAAVTRGNAGRFRTLHDQGGTQVVSDHDGIGVYLKR
ncbi:endonuclease/exonuclease/phosphatase family protein [Alcanivorax sp. JB21]|uniref:endonuclease/exonuclease/phosphatase family protein n=1 Tax=Alcanivorax limicola TaxID=2874102 RepID=UPI001CC13A38|nr:endonuclease/exonuclease/phosphatase family protein [Alcanivorax limicola]MBZ2188633.1 endonuclease/exonuclease/phosphatase family protein [Alcanivorax limicola]